MSIVERAIEKAQRRLAEGKGQGAEAVPIPVATNTANLDASDAPSISQRTHVSPVTSRRDKRPLVVDKAALRAAGALPPPDSERLLAAEYGRVKRPLVDRAATQSEATGGLSRIILVTSAVPGEGKTFTALNLAISLSYERDFHALLIDADVAKPQISQLFNVRDSVGFLDCLRDPAIDVEQYVRSTDMPGLSILPAGSQSDHDSELLASRRMATLMGRLVAADERRIVILDSPPLLLTNEARELSASVGQIVMIVRAGLTPQQVVLDALNVLGESRSVSLLLTQVPPSKEHGQYYGYGRYGEYGRNPPREPAGD